MKIQFRNPFISPRTSGLLSLLCLLAVALTAPASLSADESLQNKLDRLSARSLDEVPAAELIGLIREGMAEGELVRVGGLVENFLRVNPDATAEMYLWSARLAVRLGQMRQAALRYKQYLDRADNNAASREVGSELFEILIDYLGDIEDAYVSIQRYPAFSGPHAASARHNLWLFQQALERNDIDVMAVALERMLRYEMPEEQRQLLVWGRLDQLRDRLVRHPDQARQAASELEQLVRAIPDAAWKTRIQLLKDYAVYRDLATPEREKAEGEEEAKEPAELTAARTQLYASLEAAQAADNTGAGLMELMGWLFRLPITFDQTLWQRHNSEVEAFRAFFPKAFARLPEAERKRFLDELNTVHGSMIHYLATGTGWTALILDHPEAFTDADALGRIAYAIPKEREALQALARITRSEATQRGASVRAVAAESDPIKAAAALPKREGDRLPGSAVFGALNSFVVAHFRGGEGWSGTVEHGMRHAALKGMFQDSAWARWRADDVRTFLDSAWHIADDPAKSTVREALEVIAWVPFPEEVRNRVYEVLASRMTSWEETLVKAEEAEQAAKTAAAEATAAAAKAAAEAEEPQAEPEPVAVQLPQIAKDWPVEAREAARETIAFYERLRDGETVDSEVTLYATLQAFGKAALAGDQAAFDQTGRKAVDAVLAMDVGHELSALAGWHWLAHTVGEHDSFELRLYLLERVLGLNLDEGWASNRFQRATLDAIGRAEGWDVNHGRFRPGGDQKENAEKVMAVIKEALLRQVEAGRVSQGLLWLYEEITNGSVDKAEWVPQVLKPIIESGVLRTSDFNPGGDQTVTTWEMLRVRHHYRSELENEFPWTDWFDDRMVEDIRQADHLHIGHYSRYHEYGGGDREGRIAAALLEHVKNWERYPLDDRGLNLRISVGGINTVQGDRIASRDIEGVQDWFERMRGWIGTTRFDYHAAGFRALNHPSQVSGVQIEDRDAFFADLKRYLDHAEKAPDRFPAPRLNALVDTISEEAPLTGAEIQQLDRLYRILEPGRFGHRQGHDTLIVALLEHYAERGDWNSWTTLVPIAWQISKAESLLRAPLRDMGRRAVANDNLQQAAILSSAGIHILSPDITESLEADLARIRSEALIGVGALVPVPAGHPDHGAFSAQAAYLSGVLEQAWRLFERHRERIWEIAGELDPSFLVWVVEENLRRDELESATTAIRLLVPIFDQHRRNIHPEAQARLALATAEVPIRQREFSQARAQLRRLLNESEWQGTRARDNALLRLTDVEKYSRNFEEARVDLERHAREGSDYLRIEARYRLALLLVDMEEYVEAGRALRQVFAREPHHPQARILEGRLNVLTGRFVEATEIPIGFAEAQRYVIPGRPLRVRLEDDNLAVVGASRSIEVRVWTDDGDEEFVRLLPIGDSRTRFDVQVPTQLGQPKPGDSTLQLLGNTRIYYDFSDAFKEQNNVRSEPSEVAVASDARLLVSSGAILTDEEITLREVERQLMAEEGSRAAEAALSLERPANQVRPGGAINIRVEDPVKSVTSSPDTVRVRVSSREGEEMELTLEETGPTTGVFERALETDRAPPFAFASDVQTGFTPAAIINPDPDVAWVGRWDNQRPKFIGVDLLDSVTFGTVTMEANQEGRRVTAWRLEASNQGRNYRAIAAWPDALEPWDGQPRISLAGHATDRRRLRSRDDIVGYIESGRLVDNEPMLEFPFQLTGSVRSLISDNRNALNVPHGNHFYTARWQAGLYIPSSGTLTLRLQATGSPERVYFTVGDEPVVRRGGDPFQTTRSFARGAVPLEIAFMSRHHRDVKFVLEWDLGQTGTFEPVPEEYLDPETHSAIADLLAVEPSEVTVSDDQTRFEVQVAGDIEARMLRFVLLDFEGDAPLVNRITLNDGNGEQVLPLPESRLAALERRMLFIAPGDTITVIYEDDRNPSDRTRQLDRQLTATYHNAKINAVFSRYVRTHRGEEEELLVPARRYLPGDGLNIVIQDPDADSSSELDEVPFEVVTESGERIEVIARETGAHTGSFIARIFPVLSEGDNRPAAIRVQSGEAITLRYRDAWNTDPGVPVTRETIVEQAAFSEPQLRVFEARTEAHEGEVPASDTNDPTVEYFPRVRDLTMARPDQNQAGEEVPVLLDAPLWVEVMFPFAARAADNEIELFAQAESARRAAGEGELFDLNVPGTIRLSANPSSRSHLGRVPFYRHTRVEDPLERISALDVGRFTFPLPVAPGDVPAESLVDLDESDRLDENLLHLPGGDSIRIGFRYKNADGQEQWATMLLRPDSDAFMDLMDRQYRERLESARVGDRVYMRLIDRKMSGASGETPLAVTVRGQDGTEHRLELLEAVPHSGIFRTPVQLVFADEWDRAAQDGLGTELPVRHGERLTFVYKDPKSGDVVAEHSLEIPMGVDVSLGAFSKMFRDGQMAVDTLFTMAESHYELARRHREMENLGAARRHIEQGRRILDEGLRDYPESENRDQAEYLLANLALELATLAENEEIQQRHFQEALARLNEVVAVYPNSSYAPMAQFRKGILFERMGESERASEEFVRLSYRYPDSPLVGETIVRLGRFFMAQAREHQQLAENEQDAARAELLRRRSVEEFTTAGEVFSRLSVRFPEHQLAQRADVLSGQSYLRAELDERALKQFERVVNESGAEPRVRAEALYWLADIHARNNRNTEAYRRFTEITWDYPESEWARYSRGRLTEPNIARAGQQAQ